MDATNIHAAGWCCRTRCRRGETKRTTISTLRGRLPLDSKSLTGRLGLQQSWYRGVGAAAPGARGPLRRPSWRCPPGNGRDASSSRRLALRRRPRRRARAASRSAPVPPLWLAGRTARAQQVVLGRRAGAVGGGCASDRHAASAVSPVARDRRVLRREVRVPRSGAAGSEGARAAVPLLARHTTP